MNTHEVSTPYPATLLLDHPAREKIDLHHTDVRQTWERHTPLRAYARQIAKLKGEAFSVVTIPEGASAHRMGYRFVSIPDTELPYYLGNGAALA